MSPEYMLPSVGELLWKLACYFAQTLGIAALFVTLGALLITPLGSSKSSAPKPSMAITVGFGYFIGMALFLAAFVPLSRLLSAKAAFYLLLAVSAGLAFKSAVKRRREHLRSLLRIVWAITGLTLLFATTNAFLWISPGPEPWFEPTQMTHYGTIHSGRYANYAIFIAQFDRVPFLAQNGGQSILAAFNMMLGARSALASLMAWLPVSLAFLAVALYGLLRSAGGSAPLSLMGTAICMLGNACLSYRHGLVLDNGVPMGFIGYTDFACAMGSILFFTWLVSWREHFAASSYALIATFALSTLWAWAGLQNIVAAAVILGGAFVHRARSSGFRSAAGGVELKLGGALLLGAIIGAVQFGPLLPRIMQEDIGLWTADFAKGWRIDLGLVYLLDGRWNERDLSTLTGIWQALSAYAVPAIGIAALSWAYIRDRTNVFVGSWLAASALSYAVGFFIVFCISMGGVKWPLTRFMGPGVALGMVALVLAYLSWPNQGALLHRAAIAFAALILYGPLSHFLERAKIMEMQWATDSLGRRLGRMVAPRGFFLLWSAHTLPSLKEIEPLESIDIGVDGKAGWGIETRLLSVAPGRYVAAFKVEVQGLAGGDLFDLAVRSESGGAILARRTVSRSELEVRAGARWATIEFRVVGEGARVQIRLASMQNTRASISDIRLERRRER